MAMIGNFNDELARSPYGDFLAMQRPEVFDAFNSFIKKEKPSLIVEIGTAFGGLALALHRFCQNHKCKFITYDIYKNSTSSKLTDNNVDFRIEDIFYNGIPSWKEYTIREKVLEEFNSFSPPRIFLCDGGNKIAEYNAFSKIVKPNDIIMAHDFAYDDSHAHRNIKEGIWAWTEIKEQDIKFSMNHYSLEYYQMKTWEKLAWVCTRKIK